ncbi:DUF402 domain-containing protein [Haloarculaceae archaeon H-GB2-1]|nr:DUF402 domain-containing protein [Haloarculaceae archaeon H-GB1-1]MEA5406798.1 DUF402 domain-containing protein [Haloarculaceae archaeon H-GB2-1]
MTVRIRGIYTTALTHLLTEAGVEVVQASPAIQDRFDGDFSVAPERATVETVADRQGVGVSGEPDAVETVLDEVTDLGVDTFVWRDPAPEGGIFDGEVTETLGGGALLDLGEATGYLRYGKTDDRIEEGDRLRVQVTDPAAPWERERPSLDTSLSVGGGLLTLARGGSGSRSRQPEMAEILPTDPPEGWRPVWSGRADDAGLDALDDALSRGVERAEAVDDALGSAPDEPGEPGAIVDAQTTAWVWFGRESRFALDEARRAVTTTMAGHHRTKAANESASAAVDLVEALHPDADAEFPFAAVTRQFGPTAGDSVGIGHGKPDGRLIELGDGHVVERDPEKERITVEREMSPGGTYDALGTDREAGDVAVTKFTEGKWWYPTTYRDADGNAKGTYVNICTPVEVFPETVRYVDLHVDVVKHADGTVERVDDDELDAAVEAGYITDALAEKARSVAGAVANAL